MSIVITTLPAWPRVRRGANGHPVQTLQHLLRHRGHELAVDGLLGPRTEVAVSSFQDAAGLDVDGVAGPATWAALVVVARRGSVGEAVRAVQREAVARDLSGGPDPVLAIDGQLGPRTEAWVRGFQEALHAGFPEVAVDGVVGPVTWRCLVSGMLSH
ncbi:peptidoglycan hydrolase-like protein with peptidoglycan-binding domain [Cellulosimicrobium cellulans J34]|nr:peptidoglycan hydrolase-like protein with peptidoglycan-binding domain [Cellulosimicrobium cellulans J34]SMF28424.1 Peptidoglycan-binding (PGRP) domain of peptidoglycan hydrolases-containing protein [Cellulosimicrobium cellulans J1]